MSQLQAIGVRLIPLWGAAGLLALWALVAQLKLIDPVLLPSPGESALALINGMSGGGLAT